MFQSHVRTSVPLKSTGRSSPQPTCVNYTEHKLIMFEQRNLTSAPSTPSGAPQHSTTRKQEHGSRAARSGRFCPFFFVMLGVSWWRPRQSSNLDTLGAYDILGSAHQRPRQSLDLQVLGAFVVPVFYKHKRDPIVLLYCRVPAFVSCCVEGLPVVFNGALVRLRYSNIMSSL